MTGLILSFEKYSAYTFAADADKLISWQALLYWGFWVDVISCPSLTVPRKKGSVISAILDLKEADGAEACRYFQECCKWDHKLI